MADDQRAALRSELNPHVQPLVGLVFFLTAAILDALITVPFLVIPAGGSYYEFFADPGFWIIALEFLAVAVLYYRTRVYSRVLKTH